MEKVIPEFFKRAIKLFFEKYIILLLLLMIISQLAFGLGDVYDEGESLHHAYLAGKQGFRPGVDFFQHHQFMLMDWLSLCFKYLNISNSYIWGRAIVVASCMATFVGIDRLVRNEVHENILENLYGVVSFFAIFIALLPRCLVIRPEIIGIPLMVWALYFWNKQQNYTYVWISGGLFGLALYASPRFLFLFPLFVFLDSAFFKNKIIFRLLHFVIGIIMSILIYMLLVGHTIKETVFVMIFSSKLQKIGNGNLSDLETILVFIVISLIYYYYLSQKLKHLKGLLFHLVILNFVLILSFYSCWPYVYGQNIIVYFVAIIVLISCTEKALRIKFQKIPGFWSRKIISVAAMGLISIRLFVDCLENGLKLEKVIEYRTSISRLLLPSDKVLVRSALSPIACVDASYYGTPIVDSPNRLKIAISSMNKNDSLPMLDYCVDIRNEKPKIVDGYCLLYYKSNIGKNFNEWFSGNYSCIGYYAGVPIFMRGNQLTDRDISMIYVFRQFANIPR